MSEDSLLMLVYVSAVIAFIWGVYKIKHPKITSPGASVLLSFYTRQAKMQPLKNGQISHIHYSSFIVGGKTIIFRVELPYYSIIHLLGIPNNSAGLPITPDLGSGVLEKLELEGDYQKYFTLYCGKDMQTTARYVLGPKAMAFTVDFCQSHNWEIVGNELYFAQESGTGHKDDPTSMFQDISTFIDEVRPALGKPLDEKQLKNLTPYGKDRRTDLKCPVCNKEMINNGQFFKCPGHHGALVNGSTLIKINDGELKLKQSEKEQPAKRPKIIHCPSCDNKMDQVAYQGGPIQIDSCTNCHYRWLDHGELVNS